MAKWDRFDICEAYLAPEWDWHIGGWLQERPSNRRRRESCAVQLSRITFRPSPLFRGFESLSDNGKEIYHSAERRLGLTNAHHDEDETVSYQLTGNGLEVET